MRKYTLENLHCFVLISFNIFTFSSSLNLFSFFTFYLLNLQSYFKFLLSYNCNYLVINNQQLIAIYIIFLDCFFILLIFLIFFIFLCLYKQNEWLGRWTRILRAARQYFNFYKYIIYIYIFFSEQEESRKLFFDIFVLNIF